jgi:hypothetical protein
MGNPDAMEPAIDGSERGPSAAVADPIEAAPAVALERASLAGQWSAVEILARELEARRKAGKLPYGDEPVRNISGRFYGGVLTDANALATIKPLARAHGMLAIVAPAATWVFDSGSSASASGTVVVPTVGIGRWLKTT